DNCELRRCTGDRSVPISRGPLTVACYNWSNPMDRELRRYIHETTLNRAATRHIQTMLADDTELDAWLEQTAMSSRNIVDLRSDICPQEKGGSSDVSRITSLYNQAGCKQISKTRGPNEK